MPSYTGRQIAKEALRELGVLDPVQAIEAEQLSQVLEIGTDLLDEWRTDRLVLKASARSVYPLSTGVGSYTIGPAATFAQDWPDRVDAWGLITDDTVAEPYERPMSHPLTWSEWSGIRVKNETGTPRHLFYDASYDANGRGLVWVHPEPDTALMSVVLYQHLPEITTLLENTTYNLRPAGMRALKLNLAVACAARFEKALVEDGPGSLLAQARQAKASFRRSHIRPQQSQIRQGFAIGSRGRRGNIYG